MRETRVRSLDRDDPLEKEMVTHSSILAWRIPWTEEPGGLQSAGSQRVGHNWATSLSLSLTRELDICPAFLIQVTWLVGLWLVASTTVSSSWSHFSSLLYKLLNWSSQDLLPSAPQALKGKSSTWKMMSTYQFSSVSQFCPTLCNPMDCSTPGFPVHHQLLELAQTHVHRVSDAIQPSHPLSSPSPPAFDLSQHQGLL